jgi:hypothetical protein
VNRPRYRARARRMARGALPALLLAVATIAGHAGRDGFPGWSFTDVTADSGLLPHVSGALHHALAWGDFDGDGRLDLFLGNFADRPAQPRDGANALFRQSAPGRFELHPAPTVETRGRTSGAVFADLNNNGRPDLYINNNRHARFPDDPVKGQPSALYRNDNGAFVNVSRESGACPDDAFFGRDVAAFDFDNDGLLDLLVLEDRVFRAAGRSRLYRNLGDLTFQDVTAQAGLPDDLHGFGVAVADLNHDGRPDFFVAGPNRLFLSQPDGRYAEAVELRAVFDIGARHKEEITTGAVFGDIDNDGDMDLIIGIHHVPSRVRVFLNEGLRDGIPRFRDITRELAIPELPNKAASCDIADFDNDGWPDLYWSVWFAEDERRAPFICRGLGLKDGRPRFEVPGVEGLDTSLARRNAVPAGRRGMVYYVNGPAVDFDGDGRLDFFCGIWPGEMSRLFRNTTPVHHNWLAVRVIGSKMNRMGVGAKIRATRNDTLLGYREITLTGGYSGSRPALAHFGLGRHDAVDLEVILPTQPEPLRFTNVPANQTFVVTEP